MTTVLQSGATVAVSTLVALGELDRARPGAHADGVVVAAWYARKAVVLEQIADDARLESERDMFRALARQARAHADRLTDHRNGEVSR